MTRIQFVAVRHTGGFGSATCPSIGLKIAPVQFAPGCRHASSTQMLASLRHSAIPPWGDTMPFGVTRLLCTPMLPSMRIVLRLACIIQLKNCLTLLALVGHGATLDFRHGSFGRLLNLP